ncbi:MAG: cytochrome c biogenesis protein CcsA, partial [Prevotellaceae bacterium]|nr:cytochrome c biogenesis protein CcsA [Prevotellaceae bacterium]
SGTAGIFIGAIWANVSWGRYWGWDPKEVWALITMLIYSFALHPGLLPVLRRPRPFHWFVLLAFLSVLFTYFGVNFLLGGMHSYA